MNITYDEGYQFGLGVFETIAVKNNHPLLLPEHMERMQNSLRELHINGEISEENVYDWLKAHPLPYENGVLKIVISAENTVYTVRENHYDEASGKKGFHAMFSQVLRNDTSPLVRHKTLNYGDCILEKRRASSLGIDEILFFNTKGEICEGAVSNVFFMRDGKIYTPPVSCGLLPGVMRRFVMEQLPVEERILKKADIYAMDACFVTNSLMGIMPVYRLEDQTFDTEPVLKLASFLLS